VDECEIGKGSVGGWLFGLGGKRKVWLGLIFAVCFCCAGWEGVVFTMEAEVGAEVEAEAKMDASSAAPD
jgi:hypothetical protein